MVDHRDFDDDEKPDPKEGMHFEFECPECNANNPYHDGFKAGSEVVCYYCGMTFLAVQADGRLKFKAV
jgi:hypothetical protein